MKVLYCRVSSIDQKTDRQKVNEKEFDLVIEDKCSGAIPFSERVGGKEILLLVQNGIIKTLNVLSIDRLGRDYRDVINTIHLFNQKQIPVTFISQGLTTLNPDGTENPLAGIMVSIVAVIGQMEKNQIRERQLEGIRIAKLKKNVYLGRAKGSVESPESFLSKERNKKVLKYLNAGYKSKEAAKLCGVHPNTVTKIKKMSAAA